MLDADDAKRLVDRVREIKTASAGLEGRGGIRYAVVISQFGYIT